MKGKKLTYRSLRADDTLRFGEQLGRLLKPGHVVALIGALGAGKTTLVKGIARGLDVKDKRMVKSPTFSLAHRYEGRIPMYHFDAYRLGSAREMFDIGSDEMLYGNGVSLVEWADKVPECLPEEYLEITLTTVSETERNIEICQQGESYHEIMNAIAAKCI